MEVPLDYALNNIADFEKILEGSEELIHKACLAISNWAIEVAQLAKSLAPVRTGYLRDSIYVYQEDTSFYLIAEAPYAIYQELGTRYVTGKFFMTDALNAKIPELDFVIEQVITEYVFSKIGGR